MSHTSSSLKFTIYSSGESACREEFSTFEVSFDWYATLGRCASRYLHTVVSWAAGIVSILFFIAWGREERGGTPLEILIGRELTEAICQI